MRRLVAMAALALAWSANAQTVSSGLDPQKAISQYALDTWQVEQGMPQSLVNALARTGDGYLWIGTQLGLTRFDGLTFTTFNARNTPALKAMDVTALFVDRSGTLWMGDGLSGASRLTGGAITAVGWDLPAPGVRRFYETRDRTMWAGTEGGLFKLIDGAFRPVPGVGAPVRAFAELANGTLLVGTDLGMFAWSGNRLTRWESPTGRIDDAVGALLLDVHGVLWIGLTGELVRVVGQEVTRFTKRDGVPTSRVQQILRDRNDRVWIGTAEGGVARLAGAQFEAFTRANGMVGDDVTALLEDAEGSLWIGTRNGGLNRFRDAKFAVYGSPERMPADQIWSVYADRDGSILSGAERGGMTRLSDGHVTNASDGLPGRKLYTMLRAADSTLWVGTDSGTFRRRTGAWENLAALNHLPVGRASVFFEDRDGALWIGGAFGLFRYANGVFHSFSSEAGTRTARVWTICQERDGTLWFGTIGEGVIRFRDGRFTPFTVRNGLSHDAIEALYASPDGVWVGTAMGGLDLIHDGRIASLPVSQVPMIDLLSINEDDHGRLWFSSSQGLYSASKQQLLDAADGKHTAVDVRRYDQFDGLRSTEFNGGGRNSSWKGADGRLWYPSMKGLVVVDPNHERRNSPLPSVHVERVLFDGKEIQQQDGLALPPGEGRLEFRYTATSLLIPARVNFRYKLEPFDKDWVNAGNRRVAYYTGLPAGRYQFRVLATNSDGVWNLAGTSFAFRLQPHFIETFWFKLLVGLGLFATAAAIVRLRTHQIRQRARELTTLVDERTAALRTSEERYRGLFDANPQPVWVYDVETLAFLAVNQAAVNHYGYSREEFLAMTLHDVGVPDAPASDALAASSDSSMRRHRTKDGTVIEVEIASHDITFADRRASLRVITDVTERRDLEERLRQAQKMEAIGQLAGGIAHDLNNVLTAVMAHVDFAVTTLPADSPSATDLTQAQSAAHRGAAMIRKLLGFSRRERLILKRLQLGSLVSSLADTIRHMLPTHIDVEVERGENEPAASADANSVEQMLLNLATNSRDAMPNGGRIRIAVRVAALDDAHFAENGWGTPGEYVKIEVTDTGVGMDATTLARIFEPYFTTKAHAHGSGLGLAMVYGLMKQHRGYIAVSSTPNAGTAVTLYFPVCTEPVVATPYEVRRTPDKAHETILLVEDESGVRAVAARALARRGYQVLTACDGREGLKTWRENADVIDLIVSDAIMPHMCGQEMFEVINSERPGVLMMLTSGYSGDAATMDLPGPVDVPFLAKPWTVHDLLAAVREVLTPATEAL
ncbi:MAG: two-component regulator propeller domain-containing protein [bacterium]